MVRIEAMVVVVMVQVRVWVRMVRRMMSMVRVGLGLEVHRLIGTCNGIHAQPIASLPTATECSVATPLSALIRSADHNTGTGQCRKTIKLDLLQDELSYNSGATNVHSFIGHAKLNSPTAHRSASTVKWESESN